MNSDIQNVDAPTEQRPVDADSAQTESAPGPARRSRSRGRGGRRRSSTPRESEAASTTTEAPAELPPADATEASDAVLVDSVAPAVAESPLDEPLADEASAAPAEPEDEAAPAAAKGRRRAAKAPESPVAVNVVIARGLTRRVDAKLVRRVVERALQKNGWDQPSSLDVVFVADADMQEINATHRGIDEATDVLSFPVLDLRPGDGLTQDFFVLPPDTTPHLGDVVISVDRFEAQADEAGHSRQRELAFLTVHGVLHILGYDHETDEDRRAMRRREEDVLSELGLRRDGA